VTHQRAAQIAGWDGTEAESDVCSCLVFPCTLSTRRAEIRTALFVKRVVNDVTEKIFDISKIVKLQ